MIWENRKELEVWELAVLAALALLALLGLYHLIARLAYCAFGEKAKVRANEDADVRIRQDSSERHEHTKSDSVRQREAFLEEKPSLANKAAESTLVSSPLANKAVESTLTSGSPRSQPYTVCSECQSATKETLHLDKITNSWYCEDCLRRYYGDSNDEWLVQVAATKNTSNTNLKLAKLYAFLPVFNISFNRP